MSVNALDRIREILNRTGNKFVTALQRPNGTYADLQGDADGNLKTVGATLNPARGLPTVIDLTSGTLSIALAAATTEVSLNIDTATIDVYLGFAASGAGAADATHSPCRMYCKGTYRITKAAGVAMTLYFAGVTTVSSGDVVRVQEWGG
jgi:hypothetical protein